MKDIFKPGIFKPGDWNADCSMCARTFKASELRKHWSGHYRCNDCWEPRPLGDFQPTPSANRPPQFIQSPHDIDLEVGVQICTLVGRSAFAGMGIAGCMVAGRTVVG